MRRIKEFDKVKVISLNIIGTVVCIGESNGKEFYIVEETRNDGTSELYFNIELTDVVYLDETVEKEYYKEIYYGIIETLQEHREVTLENENEYIHISFEPPYIPIVCDKEGWEIERFDHFIQILKKYNIKPETLMKYDVEMY